MQPGLSMRLALMSVPVWDTRAIEWRIASANSDPTWDAASKPVLGSMLTKISCFFQELLLLNWCNENRLDESAYKFGVSYG